MCWSQNRKKKHVGILKLKRPKSPWIVTLLSGNDGVVLRYGCANFFLPGVLELYTDFLALALVPLGQVAFEREAILRQQATATSCEENLRCVAQHDDGTSDKLSKKKKLHPFRGTIR